MNDTSCNSRLSTEVEKEREGPTQAKKGGEDGEIEDKVRKFKILNAGRYLYELHLKCCQR